MSGYDWRSVLEELEVNQPRCKDWSDRSEVVGLGDVTEGRVESCRSLGV